MQTLVQDLRQGVRLLVRAPGFTFVAVAALAIGIGANTAIFSVVHTLLLQRLPYQDPERLAIVWEHNIPRDRRNNVVSPGNFIHWREMNQVFTDIAAVGLTFTITLTGGGEPEDIPLQLVSAQLFPLLGVPPAIGRPFTIEEDKPRSTVAVISDRLWRRRFGGDPSILQRPVTFGGVPRTVVGVMPPGFTFLDKTVDVWMPIGFSAEQRTPRGRWLAVVGRLRPGVTFARAQQDMQRVHAELTRLYPAFNTGWTARVISLREQLTGDVRPKLFVLLVAVAFVLAIACANVANLLLARSTARQRELAVRSALGAGRGRLVRQLLAESLVLAAAGAAAGLLLAWWALYFLRTIAAQRLPVQRLEMVGIDGSVLAFTLTAAVLSGLVFGAIPAWTAARAGLNDALKEGGRTGTASRGKWWRNTFVVVEIALALVLLVGAGLLLRSFTRLLNVDPGFDASRIVTMSVTLPSSRYGDDSKAVQFFNRLFSNVDPLPGVEASGGISFLPLNGLGSATSFEILGRPKPPLGQEPVADVRVITHDYFKAMRVPLLKGREFNEGDAADAAHRVIINEAMARKHWPGEDPLGKRVRISWSNSQEDEIIGVVGDVRMASLDTAARPTTYWPYHRNPYGSMTIAVRTKGEATSVVNAVVSLVRQQDPDLAVANIRTMEEVVANSVAERRLTMLLLAIFAGAALVLAAVGIYGVIAYTVTQRTQEIGIRMALGAQRTDVLRMIVGQAVVLAAAGVTIGGVGALLLTRLMTDLLFEVRPTDPMTFTIVAAMLGTVAILASYVPGRRATRVDPVIALRAE